MTSEEIIIIDYTESKLPASVKKLRPKLLKEGTKYCALLGNDPQQGILGCGETPLDAFIDWDIAYQYLKSKDPELKSIYAKNNPFPDVWLGYKKQAS